MKLRLLNRIQTRLDLRRKFIYTLEQRRFFSSFVQEYDFLCVFSPRIDWFGFYTHRFVVSTLFSKLQMEGWF